MAESASGPSSLSNGVLCVLLQLRFLVTDIHVFVSFSGMLTQPSIKISVLQKCMDHYLNLHYLFVASQLSIKGTLLFVSQRTWRLLNRWAWNLYGNYRIVLITVESPGREESLEMCCEARLCFLTVQKPVAWKPMFLVRAHEGFLIDSDSS